MSNPPVTTPSGQPNPLQPGDYTSPAPANQVTWQTRRVEPPSPIYVQRDDVLVAGAASSQTNEVVTINYRLLLVSGELKIGQFTVSPGPTRTVAVTSLPLAEGWLLSVSAKCAVATTRGQTFLRVFLNRAGLGVGQPGYMLAADYITTAMAPAFPNGRVSQPSEGPGFCTAYGLTPPGAGSDWFVSVSTNARWRIQAIFAQFVTSNQVANRLPQLTGLVGGKTVFMIPAPATILASKTVGITWQPGGTVQSDAAPSYAAPLPDGLVLAAQATSQLETVTSGLQSNDSWSAINLLVEEWLDNV